MESAHNLRIWGLICAQNALVQAYVAMNQKRADQGYAQAYGEEAFQMIFDEIQRLANSFC